MARWALMGAVALAAFALSVIAVELSGLFEAKQYVPRLAVLCGVGGDARDDHTALVADCVRVCVCRGDFSCVRHMHGHFATQFVPPAVPL